MDNRYFYLNRAGDPQGPFWLGEMRRFWQTGALGAETQVCPEGRNEWDAARTFPEITSVEARLPETVDPIDRGRSTVSLGVWIFVLAGAVFMWLVWHLAIAE